MHKDEFQWLYKLVNQFLLNYSSLRGITTFFMKSMLRFMWGDWDCVHNSVTCIREKVWIKAGLQDHIKIFKGNIMERKKKDRRRRGDHCKFVLIQRNSNVLCWLTFGPPPCIFNARTVATSTTTSGLSPEARHLMLKNFSIPMSAPKPASVTVRKQTGCFYKAEENTFPF